MPTIDSGLLDADTGTDAPVLARDPVYAPAADAVIAALQADQGLFVAEIKAQLPTVISVLQAAVGSFPPAASVLSGLVKVLQAVPASATA